MGKPEKWARIHGAARAIYAGGTDLFFTDAKSGDIYKYNPKSTKNVKYDVEGPEKIGGPGHTFAVDAHTGTLNGLSSDMKGIYAYNKAGQWKKIGGPAKTIFTGPCWHRDYHCVYAIHPQNNNLYMIEYTEKHDQLVGGPAPLKNSKKQELGDLQPNLQLVSSMELFGAYPRIEAASTSRSHQRQTRTEAILGKRSAGLRGGSSVAENVSRINVVINFTSLIRI
jgi:hypothetical protein